MKKILVLTLSAFLGLAVASNAYACGEGKKEACKGKKECCKGGKKEACKGDAKKDSKATGDASKDAKPAAAKKTN